MPFYEYQCSNCGHTLEAMQKITDAPLKKCPHCGKAQLQKLMSAPVFRLKGGGWYETDFKSDQDNKRNLADRPDADTPKDDKKDKTEVSGRCGCGEARKERRQILGQGGGCREKGCSRCGSRCGYRPPGERLRLE
jgi:putative FmdB family regulatory protein